MRQEADVAVPSLRFPGSASSSHPRSSYIRVKKLLMTLKVVDQPKSADE